MSIEINLFGGFKKLISNVKQVADPSLISLDQLEQANEVTFKYDGKTFFFVRKSDETEPDAAQDDTISVEELSFDLDDIKEVFNILTDEQRKFVMHIYYEYKKGEENPKIILQGPAGTGKSTIINLIEKLITWEENKSSDSPQSLKVLKCAFTGKAASNIEGFTLHHMLSIPIKRTRSLAKKRLETKREILKGVKFFICDEISMVGEKLMDSVNMRLQQIFENYELYGDRFVLLVGDLYQIDPVRQKPVYPNSELWKCCEFYELEKIIRQQDENFINALNNFRDSKMTEDDIKLLKSREIENTDMVPDSVIHLFYLNKYVAKFNEQKIDESKEKEVIIKAAEMYDELSQFKLRVKIGIRYMITANIDVGDGLANGTTGVVRDIDYDENGSVVVIWMEFHLKNIGRKARSKYFKSNEPGFKDWVPIQRTTIYVNNRKVANMFPLRAAEAMTVHKSQGQTYHEGVCIHITRDSYDKLRFDKTLQYVALTRVTRIEDLYILGTINFSLGSSEKFIRTQKEINRLRCERPLKLAYETFENVKNDVIIVLNTGLTFNEHYQFITSDKWYSNGSLLIFTETNTIRSDSIEIPHFEIAFRFDLETVSRSGRGIICYKKSNKSVKVIASKYDINGKIRLLLLLYENLVYIVIGVKGDIGYDDFQRATSGLISKYVGDKECICFIGNFNVDETVTSSGTNFLSKLSFEKKISCDILDENEENQCDMVLSRNLDIQEGDVGFYEYIPASHKPIYVKLPLKCELMEDDSHITPTSSQYNSSEETLTPSSYSNLSSSQEFQEQNSMDTDAD